MDNTQRQQGPVGHTLSSLWSYARRPQSSKQEKEHMLPIEGADSPTFSSYTTQPLLEADFDPQKQHTHETTMQATPLQTTLPSRPRKSSFGFGTFRAQQRKLLSSRTIQQAKSLHSLRSAAQTDSCAIDDIEPEDQAPSRTPWYRRNTSGATERIRRPSLLRFIARCRSSTHPDFEDNPVAPMLAEQSKISYIPYGGQAARAAAAAQNEISEFVRLSRQYENITLAEVEVKKDSESGVGIEIRDRSDIRLESTSSVARRDPSDYLPEELFAQIMSSLDAPSLLSAELVSHRWHRTASSRLSWREIFSSEYGSLSSLPSVDAGGRGLGKKGQLQDFKRMWRVRKALQDRWMKGSAAAIYLEGHKDSVYCVQFDEHKIITGSRDCTVRIWDAHTYECVRVLGALKITANVRLEEPLINQADRGQRPTISMVPPQKTADPLPQVAPIHHHGSILCLQYDDAMMVTGSSDKTLIVWDITDNYRPVRQLRHHSAGVLDVCFNETYIISCSKDTTTCIWHRNTGELFRVLNGHRGPVNAVQLRGNLVVSASGDGLAKLWNVSTGACIKEFASKGRGMACVEFSPDSRIILAGGNDQVIYQFDANTGDLTRELKGHTGLVRSLYLDHPNGRVISGSYDTSIKAYDTQTGSMICDFTGWTTSWMLSAKADYRKIVATSQDSRAIVMDFGYQISDIELLEGFQQRS
ncbi:MAG: hypothetical protein MMC33_001463 [Icmadophila ericetorum]|nr:hypothetical protein [Icmadophila ericetorum]